MGIVTALETTVATFPKTTNTRGVARASLGIAHVSITIIVRAARGTVRTAIQ